MLSIIMAQSGDRGVGGRRAEQDLSDYVAMWVVEGTETNSRRMFLAVSRLFWAIISAFWMSCME